jgi:hypothetical protein
MRRERFEKMVLSAEVFETVANFAIALCVRVCESLSNMVPALCWCCKCGVGGFPHEEHVDAVQLLIALMGRRWS